MKKIGFVDHYIGEWHADNYPAWFQQANRELGLDYEVAYFWAEEDVSLVDGVTSAQWAEKMGITQLGTLEELCEKSDVIVLLAPSSPEKHLPYAEKVLSYGKRTYIDKTFAPDLERAKEIFRLAEKYNTPFFSTSALRYAEELRELSGVQHGILTGCGSNFAEYIIHLCEMAVCMVKQPFTAVKAEKLGSQYLCRAKTAAGNEVGIVFSPAMGYSITAQLAEGELVHKEVASDFFYGLIVDILKFFEDGKAPFDPRETLEVMALRTALIQAEAREGQWLEVAK